MKVSGRTHFIIINIVIAFLQNPHTSFFNHISFMTLNDIPRFILLQKQSNIKSRSSQINRKQVQKRRKSSQGNIRANTIHTAAWRYCSFNQTISPPTTPPPRTVHYLTIPTNHFGEFPPPNYYFKIMKPLHQLIYYSNNLIIKGDLPRPRPRDHHSSLFFLFSLC